MIQIVVDTSNKQFLKDKIQSNLMKEVIFIRGPQGAGKTTTSKLLQKELGYPPYIEFDWIRGYHLDPQWKNKGENEELMSFGNLLYSIKNYLKNKYYNIILVGLKYEFMKELIKEANLKEYMIITLIIDSNKELKSRVLTETRDSGFRGVDESIKLNKNLTEAKLLKNEFKLDNSHNEPFVTVKKIVELVTS